MNKKHIVGACIALMFVISISPLFLKKQYTSLSIYTGDHFFIPDECKHLALIGCTPHPTQYLVDHGNNKELIRNLHIDDFLDIEYVTDSFVRTFEICKEQRVDHLIIAYLPIYFVRMRPILGNTFVSDCRMFLNNIVPEISKLIARALQQTEYQGKATLIVPPDSQLARVPQSIDNKDDRIRYLIKQFPRLKNITGSAIDTITIINNEQSSEDEMLIAYLKYEYLYDKPIKYCTCSTGKKRFHA